jgi:5-(carboxyamino)imidazole ribonucleotide synthase
LDYIGTLTVEFFVDRNGKILINEIAPRVHNSGHITSLCKNNINQFTMHMTAVSKIHMSKAEILQSPEYDKSYNSMINILGLSFEQIQEALLIDRRNLLNAEIEEKLTVFEKANWTLYWYGKQPNNSRVRKMGHILISAETQTKGREIEEIIKENILGVLGSDQKALLEIYSSL